MNVRSLRIGRKLDVNRQNAKSPELAQKISLRRKFMKRKNRKTPDELHADLIVFIGKTLALVFATSVIGMLYALIFVTQPLVNQAPNDRSFIDLLTTLCIFLTGSLGGVLASNGIKSKSKPIEDTPRHTEIVDKVED